MALINSENLPTIVGILISAYGVQLARELFKNIRLWRRGASSREREAIGYVATQLEKCNDELGKAQTERDTYRQQVGRRDHVILSHGLRLPNDTGEGTG